MKFQVICGFTKEFDNKNELSWSVGRKWPNGAHGRLEVFIFSLQWFAALELSLEQSLYLRPLLRSVWTAKQIAKHFWKKKQRKQECVLQLNCVLEQHAAFNRLVECINVIQSLKPLGRNDGWSTCVYDILFISIIRCLVCLNQIIWSNIALHINSKLECCFEAHIR